MRAVPLGRRSEPEMVESPHATKRPALLGYALAADTWKRFVHPPRQTLWRMRRANDGTLSLQPEAPGRRAPAFIGVRACELRALAVQDRVLRDGDPSDASCAARRADCFIIAVHCGDPAPTCFRASMHEDGPRADSGFDLALTELAAAADHVFVVEVGSDTGAALLARVPHEPADEPRLQAARERVRRAACAMVRSLPTQGLKRLLQEHQEHPPWNDLAQRCLACGNCTMTCPTCFGTTLRDHGDLAARQPRRARNVGIAK